LPGHLSNPVHHKFRGSALDRLTLVGDAPLRPNAAPDPDRSGPGRTSIQMPLDNIHR